MIEGKKIDGIYWFPRTTWAVDLWAGHTDLLIEWLGIPKRILDEPPKHVTATEAEILRKAHGGPA